MIGTSKIDIIDKYSPPIELTKGRCKITEHRLFCKKGDMLTIVSQNPGEWMITVIVENENGQRFFMKWNDINIKEEKDFDLDGE